MSDEIRSSEPMDRLTRLAAAMTETLDAHPEGGDDVRCMIFLDDSERGGVQIHGYDDDKEAIGDLLVHLRAMFRVNGMDISFVPIRGGPSS